MFSLPLTCTDLKYIQAHQSYHGNRTIIQLRNQFFKDMMPQTGV